MKNILFMILFLAAINCFGQQDAVMPQQDTAISYSGTVNAEGATREELFIRARDWLSNNLQGLQIQDKETGELGAKGLTEGTVTFRFLGTHTANATFSFNANIWVKNGRYMYSITNINNTAITYDNSTITSRDDMNSPVGVLYTSKHSKGKVLGLTQARSDETYQSAKNEFDKIAKGLISSLIGALVMPSTPNF